MHSDRLELLVYGDGLAAWHPLLRHRGVEIVASHHGANPNYLFVELRIAPDAVPGDIVLCFEHGAQRLTWHYPLHQRQVLARCGAGLSAADAILNVMPDRYAKGNSGDGNLPGFHDHVQRERADGRHGGDLQGIIDHLDYIAEMGYTAIWCTPLTESNQDCHSYHGYAATDTYRVDPRFGNHADYCRLAEMAWERGIRVVHDVVLNHVGSQHWWMRDLPSDDWISYQGHYVPNQHAHATLTDGYASTADRENYTAAWFDTCMPDLNHRNPHVATYQIQNTIWWVETVGLAALRVDTYGYSDKHFLAQWSRRLTAEYPQLGIVGEIMSYHPVTLSYWLKDKQNHDGYVSFLPSVMDFPLSKLLREGLTTPESSFPASGLYLLYEGLVNDSLYPDPMRMVLFEGNHDMPRLFSALDADMDLYKMALVYLLTMRGIPQLYYGTEILMTSPTVRDDGAFRRDFPGGWAGDNSSARLRRGLDDRQLEAQAFVRTLLQWRKQQPAIHHGKLMHFVPEHGTYVYFRYVDQHVIMVALNKNSVPYSLDTARFSEILPSNATATDVLTGCWHALSTMLKLAPRSACIFVISH